MPGWLHRLLSRSYRRALAAEAAGDHLAAAEAYALAGMPEKVAELHLVRARRVELAARVDALDDALRWLGRADPARVAPTLREELAEALSEEARSLPEGDPRRRRLATESAKVHERDGRLREAGEAHELAGATGEASRCYEAAGAIEDMERLLEVEGSVRRAGFECAQAFDEYEAAMASGARDVARAALRRCVAASPGKGYERLLTDLEARVPRPGVVELAVDGRRLVVLGKTPVVIGRGDADLGLRHAGISRRHAAIDVEAEGFTLHDAGSRNGTTLSGLAVAGHVPLAGGGTIGLGEGCLLEFSVEPDALELLVHEGPDRGLRALVARGPARLAPRSPFVVGVADGWPTLDDADGSGLLLGGARGPGPVFVLVEDVVESPVGERLEVVG